MGTSASPRTLVRTSRRSKHPTLLRIIETPSLNWSARQAAHPSQASLQQAALHVS
jgi:hypothetical protein